MDEAFVGLGLSEGLAGDTVGLDGDGDFDITLGFVDTNVSDGALDETGLGDTSLVLIRAGFTITAEDSVLASTGFVTLLGNVFLIGNALSGLV